MKAAIRPFECTGKGFASADPELKDLHAAYQPPDCIYYVIEDKAGATLGGGGIAPLKGSATKDGICEMQKLYFDERIKGKGMGNKLIVLLIQEAKRLGYKKMYIETVPEFKAAIHLYEKFGFEYLPGPLGNTGHTGCGVWMLLTL